MNSDISIGMIGEKKEKVSDDNTAIKYGSGNVSVYATPAMIGLMEGACINAVDSYLEEGMSTVGTDLKIKHTAATPVGMTVRAVAEVTEVDDRRLVFTVKAFDDKEQIGIGTHERHIINLQKFIEKAEAKRQVVRNRATFPLA